MTNIAAEAGDSLRVLLVENSLDDAELLLRELQCGGFAVSSRCVDTEADMADAVSIPRQSRGL